MKRRVETGQKEDKQQEMLKARSEHSLALFHDSSFTSQSFARTIPTVKEKSLYPFNYYPFLVPEENRML
ncbi:MAG: hypothetical protein AAGK10_22480 [Cyanobacteria bacterium J06555_3]